MRRSFPEAEPRPNVADLGMAGPRGVPDRRRSIVYLETAPQGAFEEPERAPATMEQINETFVPYALAVRVGTTVAFPNRDRIYHNVFSYSPPARFDLGRYGREQSKSVRFDRPGVVRVFCEIHSHMSAFILVFAHRFFAVTDSDGHYQLDAVPPGTYEVAVWNDGSVRQTRPVRVEDGAPTELDFVVN